MAAALHCGQDRSLGARGRSCAAIVYRGDDLVCLGIVGSRLNPQRALGRGGDEHRRVENKRNSAGQIEAFEARPRQDDGVRLVGFELIQSRLNIASNRGRFQVRPEMLSWAARLKLEVPILAPLGNCSIELAGEAETMQSSTKFLSNTAVIVRPSGSAVGRSLKL